MALYERKPTVSGFFDASRVFEDYIYRITVTFPRGQQWINMQSIHAISLIPIDRYEI